MMTLEQQNKMWNELQSQTAHAKEITFTLVAMQEGNREVIKTIDKIVSRLQKQVK